MKKIIYMVVTAAFFSLFMVLDVSLESDSIITMEQCEKSTLFSNVIAQTTIDDGGGVECNCGLLWGTGCSSSNYGNTCWTGDFCSDGGVNCND